MASNTTKNTSKLNVETKPVTSTKNETSSGTSVNGIEKTIQDNTPVFVIKGATSATNYLEYFRLNYFNSQYIFYPILAIIVFFVVRYIWKQIF